MTLIQPSEKQENVRAPYSSTTLRTQPHTHTELIPLEKSEGKNERSLAQNKKHQPREDVLKVSKVPKTMSCGQGGAKWSASESRVVQARFAMLGCWDACTNAGAGAHRGCRWGMLRWGWDAWMQGSQAERVGLSRGPCVRCSRDGCYGRGEATHHNVNWRK